jgi:hypothetical protein
MRDNIMTKINVQMRDNTMTKIKLKKGQKHNGE